MRLEKRKQLNECTWLDMRPSATDGPAAQAVSPPTRELSVLAVVMPTKSARVKREFTFTMPSKATMWMLVVVAFWRRDTSDISGDVMVAVAVEPREER